MRGNVIALNLVFLKLVTIARWYWSLLTMNWGTSICFTAALVGDHILSARVAVVGFLWRSLRKAKGNVSNAWDEKNENGLEVIYG
jgi:hypothetical protein